MMSKAQREPELMLSAKVYIGKADYLMEEPK